MSEGYGGSHLRHNIQYFFCFAVDLCITGLVIYLAPDSLYRWLK